MTEDDPMSPAGKVLRDYPANLEGLSDPELPKPVPVREATAFYTPPPQPVQGNPSFSVNREPQESRNLKPFKPFPFALKKTDNGSGFRIWPGRLISSINQLNFSAEGTFTDQGGIANPKVDSPANMAAGADYESVEMGWTGDVYAYWETDDSGFVTYFDIRGPDEPDVVQLPLEGAEAGKFHIKIGTVPVGNDEITQIVGSDIYWMGAFVLQDSGSGSDGEDPPPSGGSSEGSGKDSAIVPASFTPGGYVAWYAMESPDVRFEDVFYDLKVRGRESRYRIDPWFLEGIHADTLRVVGWAADAPCQLGFRIETGTLVIVAGKDKRRWPSHVNVKFSAIRRGFKGVRFTPKTKADFDANERRLNLGNYKK